ncbi:MAG: hypothetical protein HC804_04360, partial [Anaerolineae bacterium]|nr:hypothetical protein [Anaerolineae bacterium]
ERQIELDRLTTACRDLHADTDREQARLTDMLTALAQQRDKFETEIAALLSQRTDANKARRVSGPTYGGVGTSATETTNARVESKAARAHHTQDHIQQRRQQVQQMLEAGMDKKEIATTLGVHARTIKRDIQALSEAE